MCLLHVRVRVHVLVACACACASTCTCTCTRTRNKHIAHAHAPAHALATRNTHTHTHVHILTLLTQHNLHIENGFPAEEQPNPLDEEGLYEHEANQSMPPRGPCPAHTATSSRADGLGGSPAWHDEDAVDKQGAQVGLEDSSRSEEYRTQNSKENKKNNKYQSDLCGPRAIVTQQLQEWEVKRRGHLHWRV